MTRWELITSDDYVIASTECIIRSGLSVKAMRKEMDDFIIGLKKELLAAQSKEGSPGEERRFTELLYKQLKHLHYSYSDEWTEHNQEETAKLISDYEQNLFP
jgi:hypothetical protein